MSNSVISFRPGELADELARRGANAATIKRDLGRYYSILARPEIALDIANLDALECKRRTPGAGQE